MLQYCSTKSFGKGGLVFIVYVVTHVPNYMLSCPTRFNPLNSAVSLNNISIISSFLRENISSQLQISAGEGFLWEEVHSLLRANGTHKDILMLLIYSKQMDAACAVLCLPRPASVSLIDRLQLLLTTVCLVSA